MLAVPRCAGNTARRMLPLLDWQAPAPCPDAAAVQQRLSSALEALPGGWESGARVRGRVSGGAGKEWVLELDLERASSRASRAPARRRLSAPHCDELADAAAVAIALALGGDHGARQPAQSEPYPPSSALAVGSASISDNVAPTESTPEPPAPWVLALAADAVFDSGLLAGVGWGAAAGVQLSHRGWSSGAYGVWLPERTLGLGRGQGVDFQWLAAGARGCRQVLSSPLELDACVGIELGSLRASGYGLSQAVESSALVFAPLLGASVSWPQQQWALTSRVDAMLSLPRQEYTVDAGRRIHESPALVVRWTLGLAVDLLGS